jgi:ectoine hydroxylase-related dioxygenase (phytanoyl-CoA dioxygenase family)
VVLEAEAGRWLTAEYRMGDVLIFSIYTMHASTDNRSESAVRLSSDTRYQLASEPVDPRWVGADARRNRNPHSYADHALHQLAVSC